MAVQIHQSGLAALSRCGVAYENRYILGIKTPRSPSLVIGTAVDKAAGRDLQNKLDSGSLLRRDEVRDAARDALLAEWNNGEDVRLDEADTEEGWTLHRGDAVDASVDMAGLYHETGAAKIQPAAIQWPFTLDVKGAEIEMQLTGMVDIIEGPSVEESVAIIDLKTSGKSPKNSAADESLQLTTYAFAVLQKGGKLPEFVGLDYVVRTPKRHDLKFVPLRSTRTKESVQPLAHRIYQAGRILKSGIFTPADPGSWWCSRAYCGYWQTCPYAMRPVSVPVAEPTPINQDLLPILQASLDKVAREKAAARK